MIPQPFVRFSPPVTLCLTLPSATRPRVAAPSSTEDTWLEFSEFPLHLHVDALARSITAYLAPIPKGLLLYSETDFPAACADSMDDHISRVLHLLGSDPASALQTLIDGPATDPETGEPILPILPPRVPREISNWRAKAVLHTMGQLAAVEALLATLPEPQRTILRLAWSSDVKLARSSPTVASIAAALGWSAATIDALFIAAEALAL